MVWLRMVATTGLYDYPTVGCALRGGNKAGDHDPPPRGCSDPTLDLQQNKCIWLSYIPMGIRRWGVMESSIVDSTAAQIRSYLVLIPGTSVFYDSRDTTFLSYVYIYEF